MKRIIMIIAALLSISLTTISAAGTEQTSTVNNQNGTDSYEIYNDSAANIKISYDNGLKIIHNSQNLQIKSDYSVIPKEAAYEGNNIFSYVQISPDKKLICFFDGKGDSYLFSAQQDTLVKLPVKMAKLIFNEKGDEIAFISTIISVRLGMQNYGNFSSGLMTYFQGRTTKLIDESRNVEFIRYNNGSAYFIVKKYIDIGYPDNYGEEYRYNIAQKAGSYIPYSPSDDSQYKSISIKTKSYTGANDYNELRYEDRGASPQIWVSGNYAVAPYKTGFARYQLNNKQKKVINVPAAVYKNTIYYFKTNYTDGPLYRMQINNLVPKWTYIGAASCSSIYKQGKYLYFLNPNKDKGGQYIDIPYRLDMSTGVFKKIPYSEYEQRQYYVFKLQNGNRLCLWDENVQLTDSQGKLIRKFTARQTVFYSGNLYTVGIDSKKRATIEKVDLNGKTLKTIYSTYAAYAEISGLNANNGHFYFVAGGNLYSMKTDGTGIVKY